jgi:hypothetical protein
MNTNELIKLAERRASKGNRLDESIALLNELLEDHEGTNLAYALVYHSFATERKAYKIVGL